MGIAVVIKNADFSEVAIGHNTVVAKPTITFNSANNSVSISATEGDEIRYTLDGSTPTKTTGSVYATPIQLTTSGTHTIKAIAVNNGVTSSAVETLTVNVSAVTAPTITISNNSCTLSASGADSIKYTLDDSDPTQSHGSTYTGLAIQLTHSCTVKAIAIKSGVASAIASQEHTVTHQEVVVAPAMSMQKKKKLDSNGAIIDASSATIYLYRYDLNDIDGTPSKYYVSVRSSSTAGEVCVSFRDSDNTVIGTDIPSDGTPTNYVKQEVQVPNGTRYIYLVSNRTEMYPELRVKIDEDGITEYETSDPVTPTEILEQTNINVDGEMAATSSATTATYKYDVSGINNLKDVVVTCRVGTGAGPGIAFKAGNVLKGADLYGNGVATIWVDKTLAVPDGTTEIYIQSNTSFIYPYLRTKTPKTL